MAKEAVTVEIDMALVHEGQLYKRGDRLTMERGDALDLQALAFAHVIGEVPTEPEQPGAAEGEVPDPRPVRSASRNRYLRRDRRDEAS